MSSLNYATIFNLKFNKIKNNLQVEVNNNTETFEYINIDNSTVSAWNSNVIVDATNGSLTVKMPDFNAGVDSNGKAIVSIGKLVRFKKIDNSPNTVTIKPPINSTIDGKDKVTLSDPNDSVTIHYNGAGECFVLGSNENTIDGDKLLDSNENTIM